MPPSSLDQLLAYRDTMTNPAVDELVARDGTPRPGWDALALDTWDAAALRAATTTASRLLADDGVTYHPLPAADAGSDGDRSAAARARRRGEWRLDPLPTVLANEEWRTLEAGVRQRSRVLEAVLADLYGPRRLLTSRLVPPELLWRLDGYLRPAWGLPGGRPRLVLSATDVGRAADGSWRAISDRTQAPSGLGYAMENRRVVSRLLPDAYQATEMHRLTGFFGVVRDALAALAPRGEEAPRIVVLTPGRHSETAFDQAYIASLLGFPLVTGADLMMREGRIWTRELDGRRAVDVVLRRVDDTWCDPLELRPDSELGVPGLLEACRRGTVTCANGFGAGVVESPALAALLPALSEALLDESLLLPSAPSWWCGTPVDRDHVLANLDRLILRPVRPGSGRGVFGPGLSASARDAWRARIDAEPWRWVGQEVLPLSTTPTVGSTAAGIGLGARPLTLRLFGVARDSSYEVLPGALGRIVPDAPAAATGYRAQVPLSKDVWVLKADDEVGVLGGAPDHAVAVPKGVPMVPHALENLYWIGRYSERTEGSIRHVLALRRLATELPLVYTDPGRGAVDVLATALTHTTTTYPGLVERTHLRNTDLDGELVSVLTDGSRVGSIAHSLDALSGAASAVRDQLSLDVFSVLGGIDRARGTLEEDGIIRGNRILDVGVQVLSGSLALAGITAENMVRDLGWHLLDIGRGIERATQTATMLKWTLGEVHGLQVERHLVTAVLTVGESLLTHTRRYAGTQGVDTLLDLLLLDDGNPRSLAFQLGRIRRDLARLPQDARTERLLPMVEALAGTLAARTGPELAAPDMDEGDGERLHIARRPALIQLCGELEAGLAELSDAVSTSYFWHPSAQHSLGTPLTTAVTR